MAEKILVGNAEMARIAAKHELTTVLEATEIAPTVYTNVIGVTGTPEDMCLEFGIIAPPFNVDSAENPSVIKAPVVARVIMTRAVAEKLIKVLQQNIDRHNSKEPMDDNPSEEG